MDEQKNTVKIQGANPRSKMPIFIVVAIAAIVAIVGILIASLGEKSHAHDYGDWETVKEATATEKGEERKYCSCGEYKSREVPVLDNKKVRYEEAMVLIQSRNYKAAYDILRELGDYSKAKEELDKFYYLPTKKVSKEENGGEIYEENTIYKYNEQNLPIEISTLNDRYGYEEIYDYNYDSRGNLIFERDRMDGQTSYVYEYVYDEKDNVLKKVQTSFSGKFIFEYTYDDKGDLIKEIATSSDGKLIYTTSYTYTYDARNHLIMKIQTDTGYKYVEDYTYDANENLIKETYTYISGNKITNKITYEYIYDVNNNLIKEIYTEAEGNGAYDHVCNYIYDENNILIREEYDHGTIVKYVYDDIGNVIQIIRIYTSGDEHIEEYKYDLVYIPFDLTEDELDDLWERLEMYHKQ